MRYLIEFAFTKQQIQKSAFLFCITLTTFLLHSALFLTTCKSHFNHFEPRIIHIVEKDNKLTIYMRLPLPLLLLPNNWQGVLKGQIIPLTNRTNQKGSWQYYLDTKGINTSPTQLEDLINKSYKLSINKIITNNPKPQRISIFTSHNRKPFSSLNYAKTSLKGKDLTLPSKQLEIFDGVIDFKVEIKNAVASDHIKLFSAQGENLKIINRLANIVHLHRAINPVKKSTVGMLDISFDKSASQLETITNQLLSGMWHIIIGYDHILFLLIIIIAAGSWLLVIRNATAFTIGHTISLTMGIHSLTISNNWFIPLIELFIALSILFGAILVYFKKSENLNFSTIILIGLIHGFGFSFILNDLMKETGEISLQTLMFFNLGIEFGQLLIYLCFAILIILYSKLHIKNNFDIIKTFAVIASVISLYWIYDRAIQLLA